MSKNKGLNRIKVVLAEKQCTNKWLAEQLDKGEATISKWCTNRAQPSLETLVEIANVLQVDVKGPLAVNSPKVRSGLYKNTKE